MFTKAAKSLKEGEEVIVDGPFGIFTVNYWNQPLVLIAGGVGITPFFSIIKDSINKKRSRDIVLLYGSRNKEEIIFQKELDSIDRKWFRKVYVLSGQKADGFERGKIDKDLIQKYVKDIDNALFYICGPEGMKDSVQSALMELGVKSRRILIEDFFW